MKFASSGNLNLSKLMKYGFSWVVSSYFSIFYRNVFSAMSSSNDPEIGSSFYPMDVISVQNDEICNYCFRSK